jgi:hypothetical protein
MMRSALMAAGGVILLVAVVLMLVCPVWTVGVVPGVFGLLIVGGLLFERHGYHATADHPPTEPGWEMMAERFIDPGSDDLLVVWYNRRTGKRLYVRAGQV